MAPTNAELTARLMAFRDARDWRRFHGLKNLIVSVNLEAAELLELVQWRDDAAVENAAADGEFHRRLGEECADVFLYLLLVCERAGLDLTQCAAAKIDANAAKYPIAKAHGTATKYDKL